MVKPSLGPENRHHYSFRRWVVLSGRTFGDVMQKIEPIPDRGRWFWDRPWEEYP